MIERFDHLRVVIAGIVDSGGDLVRVEVVVRIRPAEILAGRRTGIRSWIGAITSFGSVQRTTRRNRSLKDENKVLETLEDAGIDPERVMGVDRQKVDNALDVTELSESDVYEIEESEYVRKAEVDEARKDTRFQGLKDQLAAAEGDEPEELREEIEELTEFKSGSQFHTRAGGEP